MFARFTKNERGFTLIELLVVIAIIGILSSVVLASLNSARVKGRDARRVSDIKQIQLALELFYDANQSYPAVNGVQSVATSTTALADLVNDGYISSLPTDPSQTGASGYQYQSMGLTGPTDECAAEPCASYVLKAHMEGTNIPAGGATGTIGDIDCSASGNYCMRP